MVPTKIFSSLLPPDNFHTKCGYIFQRMMDTVPADVTLSEPVVPKKWKIMTYHYELEPDGTLSISGNIRARNSHIFIFQLDS